MATQSASGSRAARRASRNDRSDDDEDVSRAARRASRSERYDDDDVGRASVRASRNDRHDDEDVGRGARRASRRDRYDDEDVGRSRASRTDRHEDDDVSRVAAKTSRDDRHDDEDVRRNARRTSRIQHDSDEDVHRSAPRTSRSDRYDDNEEGAGRAASRTSHEEGAGRAASRTSRIEPCEGEDSRALARIPRNERRDDDGSDDSPPRKKQRASGFCIDAAGFVFRGDPSGDPTLKALPAPDTKLDFVSANTGEEITSSAPGYEAFRGMMLNAGVSGAKVKMCNVMQNGVCAKGVMCPFAHSEQEMFDAVKMSQQPATLKKLCVYWQSGTCRRGADCWFAHGLDELDRGYRDRNDANFVATTRMDFSHLEAGSTLVSDTIKLPPDQATALMTDSTKRIIMEDIGLVGVHWDPRGSQVTLAGSAKQLEKAKQTLQRVTTHCFWGISQPKIEALLRQKTYTSARLTLSPMSSALRKCAVVLNSTKEQLSLGKDNSNDLIVKGPMVSRSHVIIEYVPAKGAVYVVDMSTNGTFLNQKRLPAKGSAKVVLWHGDELLLQDPRETRLAEFGYVVNLQFV